MPPAAELDARAVHRPHEPRPIARVATNEPPGIALLRHSLFPVCAIASLFLCALAFGQPFTRPYVVIGALAFALSWQLLGVAEPHSFRAPSQIEFFLPKLLFGWTKVVA